MAEGTPHKKRRITRKRLLIGAGTVVLLGVATVFLLPFALKFGLEYTLRQQGQPDPTIDELFFNPFNGTLVVRGLHSGKGVEDVIEAGHIRFVIDWFPLAQRRVAVKTIIIEDAVMQLVWQRERVWRVGEIELDLDELLAGEGQGFIRDLGADELLLKNCTLRFRDGRLDTELVADELVVRALRTWDAENPALFDASVRWEGGTIDAKGEVIPFSDMGELIMSVNVRDIPFQPLRRAAQDHGFDNIGGTVNADLEMDLKIFIESLEIDGVLSGTASGSELMAVAEPGSGELNAVAWEGVVRATGVPDNLRIVATGTVNGDGLSGVVNEPGLDLRLASLRWDGTVAAGIAEDLTLGLDGESEFTGLESGAVEDVFTSASLASVSAQIGATAGLYGERMDLALASLNGQATELAIAGLNVPESEVTLASARLETQGFTAAIDGETVRAEGPLKTSTGALQALNVDPEIVRATIATTSFDASALTVTIEGETIGIETDAVAGSGPARVFLASQPASAGHESFEANLKASVILADEMTLAVNGDGSAKGVNVQRTSVDHSLLDVETASFSELAFASLDDISIASAKAEGIRAVRRGDEVPEGQLPFVAEVGSATVETIRITGQRDAEIGKVLVDGLRAWLVRLEDGELEALQLLEEFMPESTEQTSGEVESAETETPQAEPVDPKEAAAAPPAKPAAEDDYRLRIALFEYGGETAVRVRDQGVNPSANLDITQAKVRVENIDTANLSEPMPLLVEARIGEYTNVRAEGTASADVEKPTATLMASVQALELPPMTGYSEKFIGYTVETGVFSVESDVKIVDGEMDTMNELEMRKFTLSKVPREDLDEFESQLGMPVNAALKMLRDKDDNINLSVPVQGAIDDPEIKLAAVIRKAMAGALKNSVMTVFAPLRLIGGKGKGEGGEALDDALAFQSVQFKTATAEFEGDALGFLDDMAKILNDYPGIELQIIGHTAKADIDSMLAELQPAPSAAPTATSGPVEPEAPRPGPVLIPAGEAEKYAPEPEAPSADVPVEGEPVAPPPVVEVPQEQLTELASERASRVKAYLVNTGGVAPERLLVAQPVVDDADATEEPAPPRVEISL